MKKALLILSLILLAGFSSYAQSDLSAMINVANSLCPMKFDDTTDLDRFSLTADYVVVDITVSDVFWQELEQSQSYHKQFIKEAITELLVDDNAALLIGLVALDGKGLKVVFSSRLSGERLYVTLSNEEILELLS